MNAKVWKAIGVEAVVFGLLLFGAAGTVAWTAGWMFMGIFFTASALITEMLIRKDPGLLAERMKPLIQKDQPLWDKLILTPLLVYFPGWLVIMALDAGRFQWSAMPLLLQWVGAAGLVFSFYGCYRVFEENSFLAPVVKLQADRGQTVVSTGPYAIVRHPMYAAALILFPSSSLLLGSWWGLVAMLPLVAAVIIRTALEDRELKLKLDGYQSYASKVQFRLVPGLW